MSGILNVLVGDNAPVSVAVHYDLEGSGPVVVNETGTNDLIGVNGGFINE